MTHKWNTAHILVLMVLVVLPGVVNAIQSSVDLIVTQDGGFVPANTYCSFFGEAHLTGSLNEVELPIFVPVIYPDGHEQSLVSIESSLDLGEGNVCSETSGVLLGQKVSKVAIEDRFCRYRGRLPYCVDRIYPFPCEAHGNIKGLGFPYVFHSPFYTDGLLFDSTFSIDYSTSIGSASQENKISPVLLDDGLSRISRDLGGFRGIPRNLESSDQKIGGNAAYSQTKASKNSHEERGPRRHFFISEAGDITRIGGVLIALIYLLQISFCARLFIYALSLPYEGALTDRDVFFLKISGLREPLFYVVSSILLVMGGLLIAYTIVSVAEWCLNWLLTH